MNPQMNPQMNTPNNSEIVDNNGAKKRTTLPAKYNQLMVFGYWLFNQMKVENDISSDMYQKYLNKFHIFDGVDAQKEYFDAFFEDFKIVNKHVKTDIRNKEKERRQIEKKNAKKNAEGAQVEKKKRGRKKKEVIDTRTPEEILIDEIIAKANSGCD